MLPDQPTQQFWLLLKPTIPLLVDFACLIGLFLQDAVFLVRVRNASWQENSFRFLYQGHVGADQLAGSSVSFATQAFIAYFVFGLAYGMDTYVSQAHGAKNYRLIGTTYQMSIITMTAASVPLVVFMWYIERVMLLLGQDASVAYWGGMYARWMIPGIFPYVWSRATFRLLQMRGLVLYPMVMGIIQLILNAILNYILIFGIGSSWEGLGFIGAPISTSLVRIVTVVLLVVMVKYYGLHEQTSTDSIHPEATDLPNIIAFLKVATPAALMFWLEEMAFNGMTFLAGYLHSTDATVANAIGINVLALSFTIPIAFGSAASGRIGALLGEGNYVLSRQVSNLVMIATISWMWVNGIVIVVLRSSFISVFLREEDRTPEVVQILNSVLVITGAACVMDGIQVVAGSIVRAVGNPMVGTIVGLIAHYIFTLPLGGALALNGVGLNGLWYGLTMGLTVAGVMYGVYIWRLDWAKEAENAKKRVGMPEPEPSSQELDSSASLPTPAQM